MDGLEPETSHLPYIDTLNIKNIAASHNFVPLSA